VFLYLQSKRIEKKYCHVLQATSDCN